MSGGTGLNGTARRFESTGLTPGYLLAVLAGNVELFGGSAPMIGLLVCPASAVVGFIMIVVIFGVRTGNGFFITDNGHECALTLSIISVTLLIDSAGELSLDGKLSRQTGLVTKKGGHLRVVVLFRCGVQHKVSTSPATPGLHS